MASGDGLSLVGDKNHFSFARTFFLRGLLRPKVIAICVASLVALGLFFSPKYLFALHYSSPIGEQVAWNNSDHALANSSLSTTLPAKLDPLDPLVSLNGPPTMSFRDNLRNDTKYITSWIAAGWTNDVMTYVNLIYLGMITDRIPILGPFTPSHGEDGIILFSEVFDLPRLREALRIPILEWQEVKDEESEVIDDLGCWGVWETVQYDEHKPRHSLIPDIVKLDISYTKAPDYIKLRPGNPHDKCSTFWSLATLAFPTRRNQNLRTPLPSPLHQVSLPPDDHLLCFDYLYYVCAYEGIDFGEDYSPAFRHIARYLYWTSKFESLAGRTLRQTIGSQDDQVIPPYITVHVRHREFAGWCETPIEDCFAPLSVIARRVQEVKDELLERKGIVVEHVIMTSDEKDPAWWKEVHDMGWLTIDHKENLEEYGSWYPPLIDAVIQSHSTGFVGTDRSTFSMMAAKRVMTWHDGPVRMFKWGKPGADDH